MTMEEKKNPDRKAALSKEGSTKPIKKKALVRYQRFLKLATRTGVVILAICFVWISVDGYHRLVSQKIIQKSAPLIIPLESAIEESVLEEIKKKQYFAISQADSFFSLRLDELSEEDAAEEGTVSGEEANEE